VSLKKTLSKGAIMAFSEYYGYRINQLRQIFNIVIKHDDLFATLKCADNQKYSELQKRLNNSVLRIKSVTADNEATRKGLLVTPVVSEACFLFDLGLFLEKELSVPKDKTPELPHNLTGNHAISMDIFDFICPVISVIEAKPSELSKGIGQCLSELVATLRIFKDQNQVYGIITDGEIWEFMLLTEKTLILDDKNYHVSNVNDIIERIGHIVQQLKKPPRDKSRA
jgi:hypothetical protein